MLKKVWCITFISFVFFSFALAEKLTLESCIKIAKENYKPLRLAEQELFIAKFKHNKSIRTLFPQMQLIAEETIGETDLYGDLEFKEQRLGMKVASLFMKGENF